MCIEGVEMWDTAYLFFSSSWKVGWLRVSASWA